MPIAVLFPGQASQTPGMRDDVAAVRPDLLERVAALVGDDPFAGADADTRFAQPAIFCASLAGWAARDRGADAVAGHSLGELSALTAAGVLEEDAALRLVVLRGRLMSACPAGTMVAALGGGREDVAAVARRHGVAVANDNAPGQLVLSGARPAVAAAVADLRAAGVRTLELAVSGAFHSPLMAPALAEWSAAVDALTLRPPQLPVYSCLTAGPLESAGDVRAALAGALTEPVRWRETVLALDAAGIDGFEEAGPGRTLTRLVARTLREPAHA